MSEWGVWCWAGSPVGARVPLQGWDLLLRSGVSQPPAQHAPSRGPRGHSCLQVTSLLPWVNQGPEPPVLLGGMPAEQQLCAGFSSRLWGPHLSSPRGQQPAPCPAWLHPGPGTLRVGDRPRLLSLGAPGRSPAPQVWETPVDRPQRCRRQGKGPPRASWWQGLGQGDSGTRPPVTLHTAAPCHTPLAHRVGPPLPARRPGPGRAISRGACVLHTVLPEPGEQKAPQPAPAPSAAPTAARAPTPSPPWILDADQRYGSGSGRGGLHQWYSRPLSPWPPRAPACSLGTPRPPGMHTGSPGAWFWGLRL